MNGFNTIELLQLKAAVKEGVESGFEENLDKKKLLTATELENIINKDIWFYTFFFIGLLIVLMVCVTSFYFIEHDNYKALTKLQTQIAIDNAIKEVDSHYLEKNKR